MLPTSWLTLSSISLSLTMEIQSRFTIYFSHKRNIHNTQTINYNWSVAKQSDTIHLIHGLVNISVVGLGSKRVGGAKWSGDTELPSHRVFECGGTRIYKPSPDSGAARYERLMWHAKPPIIPANWENYRVIVPLLHSLAVLLYFTVSVFCVPYSVFRVPCLLCCRLMPNSKNARNTCWTRSRNVTRIITL